MKKTILFIFLFFLITGCTIGYRYVGNSEKWPSFENEIKPGSTMESDLLKVLGPPSLVDMKSMKGKTVYYYWMERLKNRSLYLLVYNYWDVDIKYDRAMFVFKDGILEQYGIHYDARKRKD